MSRQQQKWTLLYNLLERMAGKVLTGEHPDPCAAVSTPASLPAASVLHVDFPGY